MEPPAFAPNSGATPLLALSAVALDLETTSVDSAQARAVQIGAIRVAAARIVPEETYSVLVNPGIPVPKVSSAVHGLTDKDLAGSPPFVDRIESLEAFLGGAVLIGHTIGYDLTVLQREYELAGRSWTAPRALCVRMLARVAVPSLAGYSLDQICAWLDVPVANRHTALGDAIMAGEVFARLIEPLRARGVRTLAEADAACARLGDEERRHVEAGWVHPSAAREQHAAMEAIRRIDAYPFRHRVKDIMRSPACFAPPAMTAGDALGYLLDNKISSVFVKADDGRYGIVTERDLLRALDPRREGGAASRLDALMSTPLHGVPEDAFLYRAMGRMNRLRVRHLAVTNAQGEITGALTNRDLLRMRATAAVSLGDEIDMAQGPEALAAAWSTLPRVARSLLAEDVDARSIAAVVSGEICAMTRRAAELAEAHMAALGRGAPPQPYAVLVLGSGGRGESLLAADQDNAIIYREGEPGGEADKWFEEMATHMAATLDASGLPLCKGGVMAKNAAWRHSVEGWRQAVDHWIGRSSPDDLLNVDIFFDALPVHGEMELGEEIRRYAYAKARNDFAFLKLLAEISRKWQLPLTILGNLRTEDGRVDLKKGGLMPAFSLARVMSIRHGILERSTPARLAGVRDLGIAAASDFDHAIAGHKTVLGAVLEQQLIDCEAGRPLSNWVDARRLSKPRTAEIRTALRAISALETLVTDVLTAPLRKG
ncbi:MAG: DUF294 nucleotidyltransferase-like domain-containing protein [Pseudomonadota bacterium]|nr:DUF294 nucleotidyltransferase-like domain-containing protein [Pseudomonadota bacterium]